MCYRALKLNKPLQGAQVHGVHQAASHIPTLNLFSSRIEGWVNPGPGCKQQLAHSCYATACGQRDSNPDLAIISQARYNH